MQLGSCRYWRVSSCPPLPIPSPHSKREVRKAEDPANPRALENQRVPALLAAQMGEESKVTCSEPQEQRAEPRREPKSSQAFPALTPLHPLAFIDHLPPSSGPPDVRKEPGASHRQKWQDLEL